MVKNMPIKQAIMNASMIWPNMKVYITLAIRKLRRRMRAIVLVLKAILAALNKAFLRTARSRSKYIDNYQVKYSKKYSGYAVKIAVIVQRREKVYKIVERHCVLRVIYDFFDWPRIFQRVIYKILNTFHISGN